VDEPSAAAGGPPIASQVQFTPSFKEAIAALRMLIEEHFPQPLAERWAGRDGRGGLLWLMRVEMALIEGEGKEIDAGPGAIAVAEQEQY